MSLIADLYRSIFRKDYESVWRQFASQNGGTYAPIISDRVVIPYKNYTLTFDDYTHYTVVNQNSYESAFTRGIVEFTCSGNFAHSDSFPGKFLITQQGFIENISKIFGAQDIQLGDKSFDKKFMVKGNDEAKVKTLLSDSSILKLIIQNKTLRLTITDEEGLFGEKPKAGNMMLYYVLDEKIKQLNQLNTIHSLFVHILDSLEKNYSIKPDIGNR